MRRFLVVLLFLWATTASAQPLMGFRFGAGFSLAVFDPNLAPLNSQLQSLNMPVFNKPMYLYGGQVLGQVANKVRLGIMSFSGSASVEDLVNGYAREARFKMNWGGLQLEYRSPIFHRFEAFGGSSFGFGGVTVRLEKTKNPVSWEDLWGQYQATPPTLTNDPNLTTELHHSFFLVQPRAGLRFYLRDWMILSGSVEVPLLKLNSGGWTVNGNDVYSAPSLDLISPFYHFSLMLGI
jgi:hypothetical protein